ncbi:cell envelope integrity protein TolA, partial [Sphaerotilus montanus]|uniref:cell envelope integrity protein TolA n=1 Tax=Sphaerotilus montanus TaxID=522889 RepID=UPI003FA1D086
APAPKVVEPPPPPAPREADIAREKADKRRREAEEAEKLARIEKARQDKAEKAAKDKEREKAEQKEADKQAALKKEAERKAAEKAAEKAAAKEAEKAAAAEKAKAAAQQEKTAKAREDNLKRLQKQLGEGSDDAAPPTPSRATPGTGSGGGNAAQSSGPSAGYAGRLRAYLKPKLVYTGRNIGSTPAVVRLRVAPDGTILSRELIKSSGQADWDQAVLDAIDRAGVVPRDTDSRVPPVIDIPWTASER